jgi:hypothetical protein
MPLRAVLRCQPPRPEALMPEQRCARLAAGSVRGTVVEPGGLAQFSPVPDQSEIIGRPPLGSGPACAWKGVEVACEGMRVLWSPYGSPDSQPKPKGLGSRSQLSMSQRTAQGLGPSQLSIHLYIYTSNRSIYLAGELQLQQQRGVGVRVRGRGGVRARCRHHSSLAHCARTQSASTGRCSASSRNA